MSSIWKLVDIKECRSHELNLFEEHLFDLNYDLALVGRFGPDHVVDLHAFYLLQNLAFKTINFFFFIDLPFHLHPELTTKKVCHSSIFGPKFIV